MLSTDASGYLQNISIFRNLINRQLIEYHPKSVVYYILHLCIECHKVLIKFTILKSDSFNKKDKNKEKLTIGLT